AVVVGRTVVLNAGCARLAADLRARGYTPVEVELDEFIKSGGSAKCLTLRLDGEEAAIWGSGRPPPGPPHQLQPGQRPAVGALADPEQQGGTGQRQQLQHERQPQPHGAAQVLDPAAARP